MPTTSEQCGGINTGCEQDGENVPGSFGTESINRGIDHGPACPVWVPSIHTRGEFVLGLGWSCVTCDTFHCPAVNP